MYWHQQTDGNTHTHTRLTLSEDKNREPQREVQEILPADAQRLWNIHKHNACMIVRICIISKHSMWMCFFTRSPGEGCAKEVHVAFLRLETHAPRNHMLHPISVCRFDKDLPSTSKNRRLPYVCLCCPCLCFCMIIPGSNRQCFPSGVFSE